MGLYVHGADGASVSAMAQGVTTTGNGTHGMGIHDDTTGTFDVDLGGGGQGSLGRNVLTGNALEDLAVNNGGRQLAAQNNWWGQAGGPNAGDATLGIKPQVYLGSPLDAHLMGNWTFDNTWMNGTTVYDRSQHRYQHGRQHRCAIFGALIGSAKPLIFRLRRSRPAR